MRTGIWVAPKPISNFDSPMLWLDSYLADLHPTLWGFAKTPDTQKLTADISALANLNPQEQEQLRKTYRELLSYNLFGVCNQRRYQSVAQLIPTLKGLAAQCVVL